MLLKFLQKILAYLAKKTIKRYKPLIIGITGSVGKSSTREAIALVLKDKFNVRQSAKNYNNEMGVPLTILGLPSAENNIIGWFGVIFLALIKIVFKTKSYPKILVLEMAADRPGDIEYLTRIAPCQIGVLTAVNAAHLEFFKNLENIFKEKQTIIITLPSDGWAILNYDDERVRSLIKKTTTKIISFGFLEEADLRAMELEIDQELSEEGTKINGLRFKVSYQGNIIPIFLPKTVGFGQVYSVLTALAVAIALGQNLIDVISYLKDYRPLMGRMSLIQGIKNSLIIDDTYNSSPEAVKSALDTIEKIKINQHNNKWLVLGDMLELGGISQKAHYEIGQRVAETNSNFLIVVGSESQNIAKGARDGGFNPENILSFNNILGVDEFLSNRIKSGDLIFIKGSQGMRMEKVVKSLMASPRLAKKYLVRQNRRWLKK
jgi:UDP-N-acetylmuramoyl-tripeptide--D-alanyl-D-alanine ligase